MMELYKKEKKKRKEDRCILHVLLFYLYFAEKYHFFEQQAHQIHEDKSEIVEKNGKKMKNKKEMSRETLREARVGMIVYV